MSPIVHLALGSNILPHRNLPRAVERLSQAVTLLAVSSVYETPPVGGRGRNFLNAVVVAQTALTPLQLKETVLRPIEAALGRVRTADKFAPRPIDLDILAWDGVLLDADALRYAHLAVPLAEILRQYPLKRANRRIRTLADQFQRQQPLQPVALAGW